MGPVIEVRVPLYPECWSTCGDCGQGEVVVLEVLVRPGETVRADDTIVTLETGKVALDIPSPHAGQVVQVWVEEGDAVAEGTHIDPGPRLTAPVAAVVPSTEMG